MEKKIGFIGCGNMGGALALAAVKSVGSQYICVSDADFNKATDFATKHNVNIASAVEVAKTCDYIFLGVKPQVLRSLCYELEDVLKSRTDRFVIVSMAAGINLLDLKDMCGGNRSKAHV